MWPGKHGIGTDSGNETILLQVCDPDYSPAATPVASVAAASAVSPACGSPPSATCTAQHQHQSNQAQLIINNDNLVLENPVTALKLQY
jgi:hypothetical protein